MCLLRAGSAPTVAIAVIGDHHGGADRAVFRPAGRPRVTTRRG